MMLNLLLYIISILISAHAYPHLADDRTTTEMTTTNGWPNQPNSKPTAAPKLLQPSTTPRPQLTEAELFEGLSDYLHEGKIYQIKNLNPKTTENSKTLHNHRRKRSRNTTTTKTRLRKLRNTESEGHHHEYTRRNQGWHQSNRRHNPTLPSNPNTKCGYYITTYHIQHTDIFYYDAHGHYLGVYHLEDHDINNPPRDLNLTTPAPDTHQLSTLCNKINNIGPIYHEIPELNAYGIINRTFCCHTGRHHERRNTSHTTTTPPAKLNTTTSYHLQYQRDNNKAITDPFTNTNRRKHFAPTWIKHYQRKPETRIIINNNITLPQGQNTRKRKRDTIFQGRSYNRVIKHSPIDYYSNLNRNRTKTYSSPIPHQYTNQPIGSCGYMITTSLTNYTEYNFYSYNDRHIAITRKHHIQRPIPPLLTEATLSPDRYHQYHRAPPAHTDSFKNECNYLGNTNLIFINTPKYDSNGELLRTYCCPIGQIYNATHLTSTSFTPPPPSRLPRYHNHYNRMTISTTDGSPTTPVPSQSQNYHSTYKRKPHHETGTSS
jgi:hypothetical protein